MLSPRAPTHLDRRPDKTEPGRWPPCAAGATKRPAIRETLRRAPTADAGGDRLDDAVPP